MTLIFLYIDADADKRHRRRRRRLEAIFTSIYHLERIGGTTEWNC